MLIVATTWMNQICSPTLSPHTPITVIGSRSGAIAQTGPIRIIPTTDVRRGRTFPFLYAAVSLDLPGGMQPTHREERSQWDGTRKRLRDLETPGSMNSLVPQLYLFPLVKATQDYIVSLLPQGNLSWVSCTRSDTCNSKCHHQYKIQVIFRK